MPRRAKVMPLREVPSPCVRLRIAAIFPGLTDLEGRLAPESLEEYTRDAARYLTFFGWSVQRAHHPQTLRAWRQYLVTSTQLSPNTINRRLMVVKTLIRACAAVGAVSSLVAADFRLIERVSPSALRERLRASTRQRLSPQQVRQLCKAPDASTLLGLRDRAVLFTLASSGCRVGELVTVRHDDVLRVGTGWGLRVWGKGASRQRTVPLTREAHAWVMRWIQARAQCVPETPWIFTSFGSGSHVPTGARLTRNGVYRIVIRYAQGLGLPKMSPHTLRRFVGTGVAEKAGLRAAQKTLGHKLIETTQLHYVLDELPCDVTEGLF